MEIRILHRQGRSVKQIALELRISRNTVRKYLRSDVAQSYGPRVAKPSKLDPFKQYIADRIAVWDDHRSPLPADILWISHGMYMHPVNADEVLG